MRRALYAAALILAAATPAPAGDARNPAGPMTIQGPHAAMLMIPVSPPSDRLGGDRSSSGLVTIFSSLATKYPKGAYWCCTGYNVMGQNSGAGVQWMGGAFTPSVDHTVTQIEVGAGYSGQGANGVVISLNEDNNGIPGTALKTWTATGLPRFGACCVTIVKNDKKGIAITGGKQYWVVLSTNGSETDTVDGWNVSDADQVDMANTASWDGTVWHSFQAAPGLAFAVRGN